MDGSLAANLYKQDSEQQTCYSRGKQALARWSINTEIKMLLVFLSDLAVLLFSTILM